MKPVQALSFDLDETLLDGSRLQESIVRAMGISSLSINFHSCARGRSQH